MPQCMEKVISKIGNQILFHAKQSFSKSFLRSFGDLWEGVFFTFSLVIKKATKVLDYLLAAQLLKKSHVLSIGPLPSMKAIYA